MPLSQARARSWPPRRARDEVTIRPVHELSRVALVQGGRAGAGLAAGVVVVAVLGLSPTLRWIPDAPLLGAAVLLPLAIDAGPIVVTRNYRDFAPLVAGRAAAGESFPGVLFLPVSISQADIGAHVLAVERWIADQVAADPEGAALGRSAVAGSFSWLPAP